MSSGASYSGSFVKRLRETGVSKSSPGLWQGGAMFPNLLTEQLKDDKYMRVISAILSPGGNLDF